jgi:hypothetical protein
MEEVGSDKNEDLKRKAFNSYLENFMEERVKNRFNSIGKPIREYTRSDFEGLRTAMEEQLGQSCAESTLARCAGVKPQWAGITSNKTLNILVSYVQGKESVDINGWVNFINNPVNKYPEVLYNREQELIIEERKEEGKAEQKKKLQISWFIFHLGWAFIHVLGYFMIKVIVENQSLENSVLYALVGTFLIFLILLALGIRQLRLCSVKLNYKAMFMVILVGSFLCIMLSKNGGMYNGIYEKIGAFATILSSGIIVALARGVGYGTGISVLSFVGASIAVYLLPHFNGDFNGVTIIIGTVFWASLLSIIIRSLILKKAFHEIVNEMSSFF